MNTPAPPATSYPIRPDLLDTLAKLRPGQRVRITQTVRVGLKSWKIAVEGTFRHVDSLATGLATQRRPQDDVLVPIVHFTKDNQEMTSIALDENSTIQAV